MRRITHLLVSGVVLLLTACGSSGTSPVSGTGPTASLSATVSSLASGGSTTLTWSSTNATACTASGGWSGTLAASGTQSTGALTATTTYSLTCTGPGGTSPTASATVTVTAPTPTVTLTASPTSVASGATSTLTWSSTNATACTAGGGWGGTLAASGTQTTAALTATTSYSLTCTGSGGTSAPVTATVTVAAAPAVPVVTLTAAPTSVTSGTSATLTWSSTNATACTASGGWNGALATSGTQTTAALTATTTYSLTCAGPGGTSAAKTATVTVTPPPAPTATLTASPTTVAPNGTSTLTWNATNATSCTASGGWSGALAINGTKSTGALTASTTYSLTCTGPGGTSPTVSALVTVSATTMSVAPTNAALTITETQQFTATVPGGGPATWTVNDIAGGNSSVGTVSSSGLYTAGTTPGSYTVKATSAANTSQTASATAAVTDLAGVYTWHDNNSRNGANTQEYALTTTNVNTTNFGKLASCTVDGAVYAQPLWVANLTVGNAKHNVVYVATEHDGLFAFDADSTACTILWQVNMIDTAHGGVSGEIPVSDLQQPNGGYLVGYGYGDITPEIGITSTPVIDPSTNTLYAVTKSVASSAGQNVFYQRLHAIDITTGKERTGSPVTISGTYPGTGYGGTLTVFSPQLENQRAGLALVNGLIYVTWGSHEDFPPWFGWIMSYSYNGSSFTQLKVMNAAPNAVAGQGGAAIWMSGGAPAADANGNLYLLTGNGTFDAASTTAPNNDYGDSLLQLNAGLGVLQYFTPTDEQSDSINDNDFGSGAAALLADLPNGNNVIHALVCGGKDGTLYVLNRDRLGGLGDSNAVQTISFGNQIFATGALWGNNYYLAGISGPLTAFALNTANANFTRASTSVHTYPFPGATPSVSSSGTTNGIVWALDSSSFCTGTGHSSTCGPVTLYAYDATNLAHELWDSNQQTNGADHGGYAVKFTVPTIANGHVYVGTRGNNTGGAVSSTSTPGELDIFGLKP